MEKTITENEPTQATVDAVVASIASRDALLTFYHLSHLDPRYLSHSSSTTRQTALEAALLPFSPSPLAGPYPTDEVERARGLIIQVLLLKGSDPWLPTLDGSALIDVAEDRRDVLALGLLSNWEWGTYDFPNGLSVGNDAVFVSESRAREVERWLVENGFVREQARREEGFGKDAPLGMEIEDETANSMLMDVDQAAPKSGTASPSTPDPNTVDFQNITSSPRPTPTPSLPPLPTAPAPALSPSRKLVSISLPRSPVKANPKTATQLSLFTANPAPELQQPSPQALPPSLPIIIAAPICRFPDRPPISLLFPPAPPSTVAPPPSTLPLKPQPIERVNHRSLPATSLALLPRPSQDIQPLPHVPHVLPLKPHPCVSSHRDEMLSQLERSRSRSPKSSLETRLSYRPSESPSAPSSRARGRSRSRSPRPRSRSQSPIFRARDHTERRDLGRNWSQSGSHRNPSAARTARPRSRSLSRPPDDRHRHRTRSYDFDPLIACFEGRRHCRISSSELGNVLHQRPHLYDTFKDYALAAADAGIVSIIRGESQNYLKLQENPGKSTRPRSRSRPPQHHSRSRSPPQHHSRSRSPPLCAPSRSPSRVPSEGRPRARSGTFHPRLHHRRSSTTLGETTRRNAQLWISGIPTTPQPLNMLEQDVCDALSGEEVLGLKPSDVWGVQITHVRGALATAYVQINPTSFGRIKELFEERNQRNFVQLGFPGGDIKVRLNASCEKPVETDNSLPKITSPFTLPLSNSKAITTTSSKEPRHENEAPRERHCTRSPGSSKRRRKSLSPTTSASTSSFTKSDPTPQPVLAQPCMDWSTSDTISLHPGGELASVTTSGATQSQSKALATSSAPSALGLGIQLDVCSESRSRLTPVPKLHRSAILLGCLNMSPLTTCVPPSSLWTPLPTPPTASFTRTIPLSTTFGYLPPHLASRALDDSEILDDDPSRRKKLDTFLASQNSHSTVYYDCLFERLDEFSERNLEFMELANRLVGSDITGMK
ncbi:hypothetical protein P7C70_g533, partial [Phenoliferia sp. Uapishka_3]